MLSEEGAEGDLKGNREERKGRGSKWVVTDQGVKGD